MPDGAATVFTLPPNIPFVDALAAGLLARTDGRPEDLSRYLVLLPTRRACRALRDAFLRRSDGVALLLPRLQPIGDIDDEEIDLQGGELSLGGDAAADLPPAVSDLRRRLLLTERILSRQASADDETGMTADQASWLAAELARLIDQVHTEGASFDNLDQLVPEELADHWQRTVAFLRILTEDWPRILEAEGAIDPADRRDRLIRAQAAHWAAHPPAGPVIAAGSTGTIPATADLLKTVASLPAGEVILPGLDTTMDADAWRAVAEDPTHPQFGMRQLLDHMGVDRSVVFAWPDRPAAPDDRHVLAPDARFELVSEAFRPAVLTDGWRADRPGRERTLHALTGTHILTYAEARSPREEAGIIALAMRAELGREGRTAALVTPDRDLARRVTIALRRWGVKVDDSAGTPLAHTPAATFLTLLIAAVREAFAPVPLMALLKHPLAALGLERGGCLTAARLMERHLLRGPRPGIGLAGVRAALAQARADDRSVSARDAASISDLLDRLEARVAPLDRILRGANAAGQTPLTELLGACVETADALATTPDTPGAHRLWKGEDGEATAHFIDEMAEAGTGLALPPAHFPALFESLLSGRVVRPRFGTHPRLAILGPLEARLQQFDLVILGGLNEGTWPALPPADPWMSRAMRTAFGLLPAERRIGLAAHDVAQALCAPNVLLTRSQRVEGTPTVPSRWLMRLQAVLQINGVVPHLATAEEESPPYRWPEPDWADWYEALDRPKAPPQPVGKPEPRPPLHQRPRKISVTGVQTWRRNPYGIYARDILRLDPLEPLDAPPSARERGLFIHQAFDEFLREVRGKPLPDNALDRLLAHGRAAFEQAWLNPEVRAFWWPRFRKIAEWFVDQERARRTRPTTSLTEVRGRYDIDGPEGPFTLSAKADRIEVGEDGGLEIIDYKTGSVPPTRDVGMGYAPQLPLEGLIARAGGFEGLDPEALYHVDVLSYWHLTGGDPPGRARRVGTKERQPAELVADAEKGLARLVAAFDDPDTPYTCRPRASWAPRFDEYEHLARVQEWSVVEDGGT